MVYDEHVHVLAAEVMKGYSKTRIIKIINCKAVYLLFFCSDHFYKIVFSSLLFYCIIGLGVQCNYILKYKEFLIKNKSENKEEGSNSVYL